MTEPGKITQARNAFHVSLLDRKVLRVDDKGIASNADKHNSLSVRLAIGIANRVGESRSGPRLAGQMSGTRFEELCAAFVESTFLSLGHLRPGDWSVLKVGGRRRNVIAEFEQYAHLVALEEAANQDPALKAALGSDYTITPDVIIARKTEADDSINAREPIVDAQSTRLASLRETNGGSALLHASISCKWTIRSDRAQNSRTEALNLIRNRKGRLPHIVVVTGEPLPSRLASIALGTGDIDCVYHFALDELREALAEADESDALELLNIMVKGKRLRDISDLPLDLAV